MEVAGLVALSLSLSRARACVCVCVCVCVCNLGHLISAIPILVFPVCGYDEKFSSYPHTGSRM